MAKRKRANFLRKFIRRWHSCVTDKDRNYAFSLPKRSLDFETHKVTFVVQPSLPVGRTLIKPIWPNSDQDKVALLQLAVNSLAKINTKPDRVNVLENVPRAEVRR